MRWRHPARGYVSPAEFVPVAEAVGLIEPLGGWVLERACVEAVSWPLPIKVAVNVSPVQFVRGDLVATVKAALKRSGLPPQRLNLEITESLFLQENKVIAATIERASLARHHLFDRRLRHRLLLAQLRAQVSGREDQDRPVLRARAAA